MSEKMKNYWPGWETVRLIGRGSFGAVYEIQRDIFGDVEKAALKLITIPQNDSDIKEMYNDGYDEESITSTFQSHLKSIIAEYSLMRKMYDCVNIVNCDDVRYIQHDDGIGWDIFIKMELLTQLSDAIPTVPDEKTVINLAGDICHALESCDKYGIVHRDIKPQNIFVSENGHYKLGDFGIAKAVEKTMGGTKIGTYKYMAPEVYNNQPYGKQADIYSLGLTLYWLLNERRMPFMPLPPEKLRAGMDEESRNRRFSGEAIPVPVHGSEELKRIVLKACAYDPKDRYASAKEMMADLTALVGQDHQRSIVTKREEYKSNVVVIDTDNNATVGMWGEKIDVVKDKSVKSEITIEESEDATISLWRIETEKKTEAQIYTKDAAKGVAHQSDALHLERQRSETKNVEETLVTEEGFWKNPKFNKKEESFWINSAPTKVDTPKIVIRPKPKHRRKSIIIAVALCCVLLVGLIILLSVRDTAPEFQSFGALRWAYSDGVLTIKGKGSMPRMMTSSQYPWLKYQTDITKIVIEDGVKSIELSAFWGCKNLVYVKIPQSVGTIENNAFSSTSPPDTIIFDGSSSGWASIEKNWEPSSYTKLICTGKPAR